MTANRSFDLNDQQNQQGLSLIKMDDAVQFCSFERLVLVDGFSFLFQIAFI